MPRQALAEQTELKELETIIGALAETVPQLRLETIQHADELTNSRRTNEELRRQWFYTADFSMYTRKDGEEFFHLARGHNNLIFQNLEEATNQLLQTGNYTIWNKEDVEKVVNAEDTLTVKLSDLGLKDSGEWSYFEIDTAKYNKTLNKSQSLVAERVYGQREDFAKNMQMLREAGISRTIVYVLNPEYVKEKAKDQAVARASWLNSFVSGSVFIANGRCVDLRFGLRGVRSVAEGDARISDPMIEAYQTILVDPNKAVKAMTPDIATGLSNILTRYINQQTQ